MFNLGYLQLNLEWDDLIFKTLERNILDLTAADYGYILQNDCCKGKIVSFLLMHYSIK